MRLLEKLIENIEEELEGAKEYAERYIECKARGNNQRASKYKEMAHDEIRHAEEIYSFADTDVEAIRRVHPLSVEDEEEWARAVKKMHECIARVKTYIA
jgi:ferritin